MFFGSLKSINLIVTALRPEGPSWSTEIFETRSLWNSRFSSIRLVPCILVICLMAFSMAISPASSFNSLSLARSRSTRTTSRRETRAHSSVSCGSSLSPVRISYPIRLNCSIAGFSERVSSLNLGAVILIASFQIGDKCPCAQIHLTQLYIISIEKPFMHKLIPHPSNLINFTYEVFVGLFVSW